MGRRPRPVSAREMQARAMQADLSVLFDAIAKVGYMNPEGKQACLFGDLHTVIPSAFPALTTVLDIARRTRVVACSGPAVLYPRDADTEIWIL